MRYQYPTKVSQWTNKNATLTNGGIKWQLSRSPIWWIDDWHKISIPTGRSIASKIPLRADFFHWKNIYSQHPLIQGLFFMKKVFKLDFDLCFLLQCCVNCCRVKIALKFLWIWNMYIIKSQILQSLPFSWSSICYFEYQLRIVRGQ